MTKKERLKWIDAKTKFINGNYYASDVSVVVGKADGADQYIISVDEPEARKSSASVLDSGVEALAFLRGVEAAIKVMSQKG